MDKKLLVEKVAAGLRKIKQIPDYMLFIDNSEDWTWDEASILDIPVRHTGGDVIFRPYGDSDCPFIPCFNSPVDSMVNANFARGYYEEG